MDPSKHLIDHPEQSCNPLVETTQISGLVETPRKKKWQKRQSIYWFSGCSDDA